MTYTAPIAEQRFVLETVSRIDELAAHATYAAATPDLIDAILEGAGAFAEGVWNYGVLDLDPGSPPAG